MLLAIDTSTSYAGIALYDGAVRAEVVWQAGRDHGRQLLPQIRDTLARLGREPSNLIGIAAARGPGSFTGLRVGLAVGRGLQFALGLPLYGVGSLDVLAGGLPACPWPIRAVLEAGRGRVATAAFRHEHGTLVQMDEIRGVDADGLVALLDNAPSTNDDTRVRWAFVGDLTPELRERLAALGNRVWVAPTSACVRRPAVLAELAWARMQQAGASDAHEGEPIYLTRAT